jgi:hypothetical protein
MAGEKMKTASLAVGIVCLTCASVVFGYSGGIGTSADPYQIADANDWKILMNDPNNWGNYFIMTADIDLQGIAVIPVGRITYFDGKGHVIRNATINAPSTNYVGLFAQSGGFISNVGIESVNIVGQSYVGALVGYYNGYMTNCWATGSVSGTSTVGGLIGYQKQGQVKNCYAATSISTGQYAYAIGGLIGVSDAINGGMGFIGSAINCHAAGEITSGTLSQNIGGLIGRSLYMTVVNCYSETFITGGVNSKSIGGLIGSRECGPVSGCYSTGQIFSRGDWYEIGSLTGSIGGLFGNCTQYLEDPRPVSNCYSTSSISVDGNSIESRYIGGFAGNIGGSVQIQSCYAAGAISTNSTTHVGGFIGYTYVCTGIINCLWNIDVTYPTSACGTGLTTAQMKMLSSFTSAGWDFTNETTNGTSNFWRMCTDGSDYPRLNWQSVTGDLACPDGVGTEDLGYFAGKWLSTGCTADNNYCGGADINTSGKVEMADFALFAQHWLEGM